MPTPAPRLIHEDRRFLVLDKPSGMLSVPGKGPDKAACVVSWVAERWGSATGPMVVHRLDMETSGLIVVALLPDVQRALSVQFEKRVVEKTYVTLLEGDVPQETGEVHLPIRADIDDRPRQVVDFDQGRTAVTLWRVLARETDRTRVAMSPITGRTHQLRVHAADARGIGRPIVGDSLYGSGAPAERLMLHASFLSFIDPDARRRLEFRSDPPF